MSTPTRIYLVAGTDPVAPVPDRLVRAANPSQALRHVAQSKYVVTVASQDDLVNALTTAVVVETAGGEE
jgi:hypothetical protein